VSVIALTIVALAASAGTGFAFGRSVPATTTTTQLSGLPLEPPIIELALQQMLQLHDPNIVVRIDSHHCEVRHRSRVHPCHLQRVEDRQSRGLRNVLGTHRRHRPLVRCRSAREVRGSIRARSHDEVRVRGRRDGSGHGPLNLHAVALPSLPGRRPGQPTPESVTVSSNFGFPPIGADGQPLCWALLPTS
jgi:hypothetical protein